MMSARTRKRPKPSPEVQELLDALLYLQSHLAAAPSSNKESVEKAKVLEWFAGLSVVERQHVLLFQEPAFLRLLILMASRAAEQQQQKQPHRPFEEGGRRAGLKQSRPICLARFFLFQEAVPALGRGAPGGMVTKSAAKSKRRPAQQWRDSVTTIPRVSAHEGGIATSCMLPFLEQEEEPFLIRPGAQFRRTAWGDPLFLPPRTETCQAWETLLDNLLLVGQDDGRSTIGIFSSSFLHDVPGFVSVLEEASEGGFLRQVAEEEVSEAMMGEAAWFRGKGDCTLGCLIANKVELLLCRGWRRSQKKRRGTEGSTALCSSYLEERAALEKFLFDDLAKEERLAILGCSYCKALRQIDMTATAAASRETGDDDALEGDFLQAKKRIKGLLIGLQGLCFSSSSYSSSSFSSRSLARKAIVDSMWATSLSRSHVELQCKLRSFFYRGLMERRTLWHQQQLLASLEDENIGQGQRQSLRGTHTNKFSKKKKKKRRKSTAPPPLTGLLNDVTMHSPNVEEVCSDLEEEGEEVEGQEEQKGVAVEEIATVPDPNPTSPMAVGGMSVLNDFDLEDEDEHAGAGHGYDEDETVSNGHGDAVERAKWPKADMKEERNDDNAKKKGTHTEESEGGEEGETEDVARHEGGSCGTTGGVYEEEVEDDEKGDDDFGQHYDCDSSTRQTDQFWEEHGEQAIFPSCVAESGEEAVAPPTEALLKDLCLKLEAEVATLRGVLATQRGLVIPPGVAHPCVSQNPTPTSTAIGLQQQQQQQQGFVLPPYAYAANHLAFRRGQHPHHIEIMSDDGRGSGVHWAAGQERVPFNQHPHHLSPQHHSQASVTTTGSVYSAEDLDYPHHQLRHQNRRPTTATLAPPVARVGEAFVVNLPRNSSGSLQTWARSHQSHPQHQPVSFTAPEFPSLSASQHTADCGGDDLTGHGGRRDGGECSGFSLSHAKRQPQIRSRLCEDIACFMDMVIAVASERVLYQTVAINRCRQVVQSLWPRAQVKAYGSFVTGLALPSSDIDLVICLPKVRKDAPAEAPGVLEGRNAIKETWQQELARRLRGTPWVNPGSIKIISHTAIPVIKMKILTTGPKQQQHQLMQQDRLPSPSFRLAPSLDEGEDGVFLDVSIEGDHHNGLLANRVITDLIRESPALRPLVLVLKHFMKERGLMESYSGGLSSYGLVLLLARYLQEQSKSMDTGSLLLGFLDFYSNHFDPRTMGVSVTQRRYFSREQQGPFCATVGASHRRCSLGGDGGREMDYYMQQQQQQQQQQQHPHMLGARRHSLTGAGGSLLMLENPYKFDPLCIEDPVSPTRNIGRNCFRIFQIQRAWNDAWRSLEHACFSTPSLREKADAQGPKTDSLPILGQILCSL